MNSKPPKASVWPRADWTKDLMFYGVITLAIIAGGLSLLLLVNVLGSAGRVSLGAVVFRILILQVFWA